MEIATADETKIRLVQIDVENFPHKNKKIIKEEEKEIKHMRKIKKIILRISR